MVKPRVEWQKPGYEFPSAVRGPHITHWRNAASGVRRDKYNEYILPKEVKLFTT